MAITIPRLFHWIWVGPDRFPPRYRRWQDAWLKLHPGWECRVWSDARLPNLINRQEFARATSFAQQADLIRYEVLHEFGGVYLDADMECLQSIEPLVADLNAFAGWEEPDLVGNAVLGAVPRHPWMRALIAGLPAAMASGFDIVHQTGPAFLTGVTRSREDVYLFPQQVFYGERGNKASCSVHHGEKSWAAQQAAELSSRLTRVGRLIEQHVGPDQVFMRVEDDIVPYTSRASVSLLAPDGEWLGHPADGEEAVARVRRLRSRGARYVAFVGPSRWWFQHFGPLREHLGLHQWLEDNPELSLVDLGD